MADIQGFQKWFAELQTSSSWNAFGSEQDRERWSYLETVNGWGSPGTCTLLSQAVSQFLGASEQYLEIGTYCGKSISAALYDNDKLAQVIDPFGLALPDGDAIEQCWRTNIEKHGIDDRITLHRSLSQTFSDDLPSIGVYYYDGAHEPGCTYHGLVTFERFLADRAIVIVDDVAMPEVAPDVASYVEGHPNITLLGMTPFMPHNQAVMVFER
jgi:predicted O-methyltransferase YrrM